ncbi:TPA: ead/Ea22-like family protein [Escherichia coli]|uniref:ead/Ea22-like family protein n=1 Tax=Escherichia coli TaxID=562 RepID=UPI0033017ACB|nr:ead/Ea22-like family protein [Escherichia coli]HDR2656694.1 ead/Ea22-like family protein [Enterobacter ludwigii]
MSNIDKRALREAVERAGQNDWEYVYTSDLSAPGRGYITVGGAEAIYCLNKAAGGVKQSENILRYIAAASPETMLALLDELEAGEKRIAEQREYYESVIADGSMRIASLDARTLTVKLPQRATAGKYVDEEFNNSDLAAIYNSCRLECEVKFKDACAAAGIKLQIEGE